MAIKDVLTFNFTGDDQTFVVPPDVKKIIIEAWGASGGYSDPLFAGKGGYTKGEFDVTPGETLYINVGERGSRSGSVETPPFNGGGRGGHNNWPGYSGGGATDVRRGLNTYGNRIIVAGGGGGEAYPRGKGGDGGGLVGADGKDDYNNVGGKGGTQTEGGKGWGITIDEQESHGLLGRGGIGQTGSSSDSHSGGGGGGGYYGGGGGRAGKFAAEGGGGGSGFISPLARNPSLERGVNLGHGKVIITTLVNSAPNLTLSSNANQAVSTVSGRRTIILSGTITDVDNDTVQISATINGKTKTTSVSNTSTTKSWSLSWDVVNDNIAQGAYSNIVVTANDGNDGVSTATYTGTITVDKTAPVITISGVSEGTTYQNSVSPTFSATDSGGAGIDKVTATLNGAAYTSGTAITTSGAKTLIVTALDKAGNQSQKTVNFTVNKTPTLSLITANNLVLTEENTLPITGSATDLDSGNVVTVKYKINNGSERNLDSRVSDGSSPIPFSKTLAYRGGRLYDGTTDVSGLLAEGTTHTLSVWATDDKGGSSPIATRSFTVKYNKAPIVTVDTFTPVQSGLIPPDSLSLSGTASDPDGNTITVKGKLNTGSEKTLLSGVSSGNWSFPFKVSELKTGANTITITATDQFGASTVKTFNVNNSITEVPMKKAVARYKVLPPLGSAKEILAWQKREKGDLTIDCEASFVDVGQPEQYVAMVKDSVDLNTEITEDQLYGMATAPKADVIFKQTLSRTNANSTQAATMLVGVFK